MPACLAFKNQSTHDNLYTIDFGINNKKDPRLQYARMRDIEWQTCKKQAHPEVQKYLSENNVCVTGLYDAPASVCYGDSGSSLTTIRDGRHHVGVTSWSEPGVFMRVSTYFDWITSTVAREDKQPGWWP